MFSSKTFESNPFESDTNAFSSFSPDQLENTGKLVRITRTHFYFENQLLEIAG
jgi:hypothetical protein